MGDFDLEQAVQAFGDRAAIGDAVSHYRRTVSGGTPAEERRRLITGLGTGEVEVLSSCMIISEGTDIPSVGGAILMRLSASLGLYLQMVGRALRPAPGKQAAVILDHVGNTHRHGLPTDEHDWNLAGVLLQLPQRRAGVPRPRPSVPGRRAQ